MTSFCVLILNIFHILIKAKWLISQYDIPEFIVSIKWNCLHMAWKFHLWFILKILNIKKYSCWNNTKLCVPEPVHSQFPDPGSIIEVGVEFFSEIMMKISLQVWFQPKEENRGILRPHPGFNSSFASQHNYFYNRISG